MQFSALRLAEPILRAVASENYTIATPIQAQAIPHILAGRDVLGCAQTGTGKTAAFALPILHRLSQNPKPAGAAKSRCLVLCPTRELATQTADSFRVYGKNLKLRQAVIFGGVGQNPQVYALRQGVEIIVATPGRLLDLMNQGHANLSGIEVLVLDEADRMLDMGFINDIRKIVAKIPANRQTLFFSATMPPEIRSLANALLKNPENIQVAPVAAVADSIDEALYFVAKNDKPLLLAHLYEELPMARTIVFTRTKRGADRVVKRLHSSGIRAEAIHGDKTQGARERALSNFRANKTPILVATDIASRGIDVDGITHVVNYDLTHEPETYVHRIGRTARAGASGCAVSFCDPEEVPNLRAIEKLIRRPIPVKAEHQYKSHAAAAAAAPRSGGRGAHATAGHIPQGRGSAARPAEDRPAAPVKTGPVHVHPLHKKPEAPHIGKGVHTGPARQHAPARSDHPRAHQPAGGHAPRSGHAPSTSGGHARPKAGGPARSGFKHSRPAGRKRAY
jgi:ATP-dependent RNA helicase RhlE